jgi:hypothetical protein
MEHWKRVVEHEIEFYMNFNKYKQELNDRLLDNELDIKYPLLYEKLAILIMIKRAGRIIENKKIKYGKVIPPRCSSVIIGIFTIYFILRDLWYKIGR